MRFFHLSDLHIGLKLYNRDLTEDQVYILRQIAELARQEQPDAIVIAGDIYDKAVPAAEAVTVFDRFIASLREAVPRVEIMLISGNHDSGPRLDLYRGILQKEHIHAIGLPPGSAAERIEKVTLADAYGEVDFYLLPFVKPGMIRMTERYGDAGSQADTIDKEQAAKESDAIPWDTETGGTAETAGVSGEAYDMQYSDMLRKIFERENIDPTRRSVLVSHQFYLPSGTDPAQVERSESERRTVGDIDAVSAQVLVPFDYAALGHIHKPMRVGSERCRYCGTPLACSVSEAGQQKGVLLVELREKGDLRVTTLPLHPLRQVRVIRGTLEQVLDMACGDYVSVVLTDPVYLEVTDMHDRLSHAFPYLLEIRREIGDGMDDGKWSGSGMEIGGAGPGSDAELVSRLVGNGGRSGIDPMALCRSFLGEIDGAEEAILQEVINEVIHETLEGDGKMGEKIDAIDSVRGKSREDKKEREKGEEESERRVVVTLRRSDGVLIDEEMPEGRQG